MLLVGSENAAVGFADGMRVLRRGGRALDAVEATIRRVESNPADHSVGYGGLPNILVAGVGAQRLAHEVGMARRRLLTAAARAIYARKVAARLGRRGTLVARVRSATRDPEIAATSKDYFGTVNV